MDTALNQSEGVFMMKTTNENFKRVSSYPSVALCTFLFITALSLFPIHKVHADPSILTGTYVVREIAGAIGRMDQNGGWGSSDEWSVGNIEVTFNGQGGFTATSSEMGIQRQIREVPVEWGMDSVLSNKFATTPTSFSDPAVSGTYVVTSDGHFTLTLPEIGQPPVTGWVSPNRQTLVFGETQYEPGNFWSRVSLAVGVKKGAGMPNTISGTYVVHEFGGAFGGGDPNGGWGSNDERSLGKIVITFNNDINRTFSVSSTDFSISRYMGEVSINRGNAQNPDQVMSNKFTTTSGNEGGAVNGTYTITPDGQFTLNFMEDGQPASVSGWVSENGQSVIFGQWQYDAANFWGWVSLGVGFKKGSALSLSSVCGTYRIFGIYSGVHGSDPNGGWGTGNDLSLEQGVVMINPDGTWSATSSGREIDRDIWEIPRNWGTLQNPDQVLSDKFNTAQRFFNTFQTGTYTFPGDGTITIHFVDNGEPQSGTVYFSEDGQTGILGFNDFRPTQYDGSVGMNVFVRKMVQDVPLTYSSSGVVTYAGGQTGTLKVLAFYNNGSSRYPYAQVVGAPYVAPWNPTGGTQSYVITGLPPGTYQLVAYLDVDGTSPRAPGELVATQTGITVVNGNLAGQNLTLAVPPFQFSGQEKVYPMKRGDQNNQIYLSFWARIPDASAVQITSGPGITGPINLQPDTMNSSIWSSGVTVVPQVGTYGFDATYAVNNSHLTTSVNLASVPTTPEPATLVSPYAGTPGVEIFLTSNKPTFTWNAASGGQAHLLRIDQNIEGNWVRIYDSGWGGTGNNHTAQMPLPSGVPLRWYVDASNNTQWSSTTAMSRSVRQGFTIAGPNSISGTVSVPAYNGNGSIYVFVYLSQDGAFNPNPENLLGTDIINPEEYTSGVTFYVIPNLPVGAQVYVAARWDADSNGVPSNGDYLGKVGPITVEAGGLTGVNLVPQTRYAEDQGAPFFAWCNVHALNVPKAGGGSEIQTSLNARLYDPNGTLPDSIQSLTVTGPGVNYTFTPADYQQSVNAYFYGFVAQPTVGEYTFTVTDTEGKTATTHCYYGGGTTIPLPGSTTLQASEGLSGVTLSWGAISGYQGNLFYRARIYDSTGTNVIWTSDFITQTSVMVPPNVLTQVQQETGPVWRVEAFDNYAYPASNNRAVSSKVTWAINNVKPYFNYATIFHRKDSDGDWTQLQAGVVDPDGSVPASIQSLQVYNAQGGLVYAFQQSDYDPAFNEFSKKLLSTPSSGVYRFVVTDTSSNTKTTYDYVGATFAIPLVDSTTFQASIDPSAPTLSWGAPTGMDRPLFYQAIVEDLQGNRVWGSDRISDTSVQVPPGMLQSGVTTYQWQVRTLDDPYFVNFSNQGRSSEAGLTINNAKPYFKRVAVFKRYEPGGGPFIFMDAMVNDPNGSVPDTIAILKVTDPTGVEYDLLPPNGTYSSPLDQEFIRKVPGTPTQGVYTFTLQDTEGNTAVTRDWVGASADIPLVPASSIVILGDPLAPTFTWSGVSGYQGNPYCRIYVQDSEGVVVYKSAREPFTAQTIPAGKLTAGRFYSARAEAQDHWMFGVYNSRSNSDFVTWFARENGIAGGSGDVDGNGYVTLADAIMALQVAVGMDSAGVHVSADVNADGKIGLSEVIYILQHVAGLR